MALTLRPTQLLPVIVCALLAPYGEARAEGERALSVGLSWATFSVPGVAEGNMEPPNVTPTVGGALTGIYEQSISTDFSLRGELAGGLFYGGQKMDQAALSYAGLIDVGAVLRFDVLKYVPYAFGGIGGMFTTGGPIGDNASLVLAVGGGLDVLTSRERSWGVEARLASFGGDVTMFTFGLRGTIRWGYF
ncbi:MAG TPA: hypothetical protein VFV99_27275 [Kofleriaceae bacterium]|nr:hypothetical protein [Kofleriaceae bacterium]